MADFDADQNGDDDDDDDDGGVDVGADGGGALSRSAKRRRQRLRLRQLRKQAALDENTTSQPAEALHGGGVAGMVTASAAAVGAGVGMPTHAFQRTSHPVPTNLIVNPHAVGMHQPAFEMGDAAAHMVAAPYQQECYPMHPQVVTAVVNGGGLSYSPQQMRCGPHGLQPTPPPACGAPACAGVGCAGGQCYGAYQVHGRWPHPSPYPQT